VEITLRAADGHAIGATRYGKGERAVLVPDINHAASLLGEPRGPIHVCIAEEREAGAHVLLGEGLGEDVVDAGLGLFAHFGRSHFFSDATVVMIRRSFRRSARFSSALE